MPRIPVASQTDRLTKGNFPARPIFFRCPHTWLQLIFSLAIWLLGQLVTGTAALLRSVTKRQEVNQGGQQKQILPLPPGSLGIPIVGEMIQFIIQSPTSDFFTRRISTHGPIFKTHILFNPTVFISGPDAVRQVLLGEHTLVENRWPLPMRRLLGPGALATAVGREHRDRRKTVLRCLRGEQLEGYASRMRGTIEEELDGWIGWEGKERCEGMGGREGMEGWEGKERCEGRNRLEGMAGQNEMEGCEGRSRMEGITGQNGMECCQGRTQLERICGWEGNEGFEGRSRLEGMAGQNGMEGCEGMSRLEGIGGWEGKEGFEGRSRLEGMAGQNGMEGCEGRSRLEGMARQNGMEGCEEKNRLEGVGGWEGKEGFKGRVIEVYGCAKRMAIRVATEVLLGVEADELEEVGRWIVEYGGGFFAVPFPIPGSAYYKAIRAKRKLHELLRSSLLKKVSMGSSCHHDVISEILANSGTETTSRDASVDHVIDQALELLFGGQETLSAFVTCLVLLMAKHPRVIGEMSRELAENGLLLDDAECISATSLSKLTYLDYVIREVLRLYPPIGGGYRRVIKSFELQSFRIPINWSVTYSIKATHDSSPYFSPDKDAFRPERWAELPGQGALPEPGRPSRMRCDYLPFGAGARACVGQRYAMQFMRLFCVLLIRRMDGWELVSKDPVLLTVPVIRPERGLYVRFRRRRRNCSDAET